MYEPIPDLAYFRLLVADPAEIPLLEAAASLGVDAYPDLDIQATLSRVDGLAGRLAERCRGSSTEIARLECASRFFFGELGFAGNLVNYYAADHSYLHRVLDTRRGIPITLALLYTELARHVGLDVDGIAFPGHFLVRVNLREGVVILDPFTGQSLDREELAQRAAPHGTSLPWLLRPASSRQILMRMLSNLRAIHLQDERADLLAKVEQRLHILEGDDEPPRPDRPRPSERG